MAKQLAVDDVAAQDRTHAEAVLRNFAVGVAPGYRPTAERFLAIRGDFIWDAVRNSVNGYLSGAGFGVADVGQSPQDNESLAYVVWARTAAQSGEQVHLYAYFEQRTA